MTSSAKAEPQGSEPSSTECRLFKANGWHCLTHPGPSHTDGQCCSCGVTREELAHEPSPPDDVRVSEILNEGLTKQFLRLGPPPEPEPPLTPEEEEEAPEDSRCVFCWHSESQHDLLAQTCTVNGEPSRCGCERFRTASQYTPCVCGHIVPEHDINGRWCAMEGCECSLYRTEPDFELPPQPERRAPYVATYSVGGHLYEVAVPGDACLQAVDGALVIRHGLGPVAALVAFQPMTVEEQR